MKHVFKNGKSPEGVLFKIFSLRYIPYYARYKHFAEAPRVYICRAAEKVTSQ